MSYGICELAFSRVKITLLMLLIVIVKFAIFMRE